MAKTYNRLEIDVNKKSTDIITAVQADSNSRYLDVSLFNNGVPLDLTGHDVKIFMQKPENGGEIWNDGIITDTKKGRCEFLMTTEALAKMGHLQTQISVWKDNEEILSTQIFKIYVTKSLLGESAVESSNEYGTLVLLFQNLYEAYALMTKMVQNIGSPAEIAARYNLATMWQAWEFLVSYMRGEFTDKVDEAIANSSTQGVLNRIGTAGDSGNTTVMGKLNAIFSRQGIKNIQRVTYNTTTATRKGGSVTISTVNPAKTIVFSERLFNNYSYLVDYSYTLQSNSITITHADCNPDWFKLGFWVVEFV